MEDHVVLDVGHVITSETQKTVEKEKSFIEGSSNNKPEKENKITSEEEEPLIQTLECRICQEEDHIKNLEIPCACSGSLKYAHRACVQRWCNEKGDTTCEICHETYKPDYTATPQLNPDETTIDISGDWNVTGRQLDLHDPRVLAMAAAQRRFLEAEYNEYASTDASVAAFFRSAALILLALLLLRHALSMSSSNEDEDDDDASTYFSLILLRAAGFLLPFYVMAWAVNILQRRRQRQEAAALAASDVAFIMQSGQGLQFTMAPDSPATPQQEPLR